MQFIRKWRLKHRAVADSLEEAGDRLFTFTRLPPSQWCSARTTDEIDKHFLSGRATDEIDKHFHFLTDEIDKHFLSGRATDEIDKIRR
jgi:hypothetical protein